MNLIHGTPRKLAAIEHNHSGRLLRQLHSMGKSSETIYGLAGSRGALTIPSLKALNCYLKHAGGLEVFRRKYGIVNHRLAWSDLQRLLSLKWQS